MSVLIERKASVRGCGIPCDEEADGDAQNHCELRRKRRAPLVTVVGVRSGASGGNSDRHIRGVGSEDNLTAMRVEQRGGRGEEEMGTRGYREIQRGTDSRSEKAWPEAVE